jgi:hypothetical protein
MVRRMIPTAGSRHARIELEFQTDDEAASWSKGLPQGTVNVAWDGRKVMLTPAVLVDFESAQSFRDAAGVTPKPAPVVPPVATAPPAITDAFAQELAAMSEPDLDTLRAEMSLPRIKGETPAELKLRILRAKRKGSQTT